MQDRELVAAIVKGEPDALAEAYDRYGAPLYGYCRSMLPEPHSPGEAADVVADTFTVATARLQGLRDPDQLGAWLQVVARNECLRRLGAADGARLPAPEGPAAEVRPPDSLRERVLQGGADTSPTGRAHRASVTHRAGTFGPTGFPKPVIPPGPQRWHEVRRRPRAAAAVAALALAVVAGGITTLLVSGGTHRAQASTVALGGGTFATSGAPSVTASSQPAGRPSPSRKPTPAPGSPGTKTSPADEPTPGPATSPGVPRSSAPARGSPSPSPSASSSPSPSPSSSPPPPPPGTLQVTPRRIVLSAPAGKPASATFIVTAVGGPVNFVITSPNAHVTVSPPSGSLSAAGSWVTVSVTVRSKVALSARLMVNPGALVVTVVFSIKA